MIYDHCVVGGGIVGLATALAILRRRPGSSLLILEKEDEVARHQTGHNSGVIHAGIYYQPGSLKARLCTEGLRATKAFCDEHGIRYETCGKLIVATDAVEDARIDALYDRATANGLSLRRIGAGELKDMEPNIVGTGALLSPETAIVDYREVSRRMAALVTGAGAELLLGTRVDRVVEGGSDVEIGSGDRSWRARKVVFCAGLQSDRLARLAGARVDYRIVPFRGEYYRLPPERNDIVSHLIYPAPDPDLPFLGIHLTRMIDGSVTVGPNAVLGLAREGYPRLSVNPRDLFDLASYGGFWKLIYANRRHALAELRDSLSRRGYLEACRKYCPGLTLDDLQPYPAGIRAQAVTRDGVAIHDFLFAGTDRTLHVCNAPSPAATSAIPIGSMITDRLLGTAAAA